MAVFPIVQEPLARTGHYPHLAKNDAALWERFLDQFGAAFLGVAYDVALGGLEATDAALSERERRGWQYSTAVKLDAVLFDLDQVWCVEVKPRAGLGALGQALGGAVLWDREPLDARPAVPLVVTDRASDDVKHVAAALGIHVAEVGAPVFPDLLRAASEAPPP